jgi:flavin reductase (DIM6/NTAB) family NADH-FMN oxidoreductase RutF
LPVSPEDFKLAMSHWATGVAIVTARAGDRVHGMTVSDFSGVSLSPPLVVVCADKSSETYRVIAEGRCFGVNVLTAAHEALSNKFASKKDEFRRFEGLETTTAKTGAPLLPDALVSLDCTLEATHDAGDHVLYVGRVEEANVREGEPLVYFRGGYRGLAE